MSTQNGSRSKASTRDSSPPSRQDSPVVRRQRSDSPRRESRSEEWGRRTYSRSPSPDRSRRQRRRRSRSRPRTLTPWRQKLDWLIDSGKLRSSDIDSETMSVIENLEEEVADTVLARFAEVNFSRVSNLSGFLMGIVRRIQKDGVGQDGRTLEDLPRPLKHGLLDLVDTGRLRRSEIDARMTRALGSLPTDVAMEVLDKFSNANLDGIRSKTGFMLGIVKRLQGNDDYRHRRGDRRDRYR